MILQQLYDRNLIKPPKWLLTNTQYLTIMGSTAYGVSSDSSDFDVYGFCIPPKEMVFPHLAGEIDGFGTKAPRFEQWQEHHVQDRDALGGKGREYDFSIFSIVKQFKLAMENNPNMLDALFTPHTCVLHSTKIANMVRERRKIFLHKGAWAKFKGYAYSQAHKVRTKDHRDYVRELRSYEEQLEIPHDLKFVEAQEEKDQREKSPDFRGTRLGHLTDSALSFYVKQFREGLDRTTRFEMVKVHGYDVKFAYHIIRLLDECKQILTTGDIDLQSNREELKAIRRGEWSEEHLFQVMAERERQMEAIHAACTILPDKPNEAAIRALLLECLEEHYGSLDNCVVDPDRAIVALRNIRAELDRVDSIV